MMDVAQLGDYIREHFTDHPDPTGRTAFRLETLDAYEVASDGSDFARWLAGEPAPTPQRKEPWLARLRSERDRGLYRSRVHVVESPLSDYLRYECEWSYLPNGEAGEDIRILDLSEVPLPADEHALFVQTGDFWLINGQTVRMDYDNRGQFVSAQVVRDGQNHYHRAAEVAWDRAEPFRQWWDRHPTYHRQAA